MKRLLISRFWVFGLAVTLLSTVTFAEKKPKGNNYQYLQLFSKVLSYVENRYINHVDSKKLIYGAIDGLLRVLDPYSTFLPPDVYKEFLAKDQSFGGIGLEILMDDGIITVITPLDGSPACRAGIRPGDEIVEINRKAVREMNLIQAINLMRGKIGSAVRLLVIKKGSRLKQPLTLRREKIQFHSVTSKSLPQRIGYVRIRQFQTQTILLFQKELNKLEKINAPLKGLIIDLRNNPGGLLNQAIQIADEFIAKGLIVTTESRNRHHIEKEYAHKKGTRPNYPIVILINKGTASASEIVAGALQDHKRATILGTQSFGKGSVQSIIELGDGSAIKLTVAYYYTPKHRRIHKIGIVPDIKVLNLKSLKDPSKIQTTEYEYIPFLLEEDLQLKAALELLNRPRVNPN